MVLVFTCMKSTSHPRMKKRCIIFISFLVVMFIVPRLRATISTTEEGQVCLETKSSSCRFHLKVLLLVLMSVMSWEVGLRPCSWRLRPLSLDIRQLSLMFRSGLHKEEYLTLKLEGMPWMNLGSSVFNFHGNHYFEWNRHNQFFKSILHFLL